MPKVMRCLQCWWAIHAFWCNQELELLELIKIVINRSVKCITALIITALENATAVIKNRLVLGLKSKFNCMYYR